MAASGLDDGLSFKPAISTNSRRIAAAARKVERQQSTIAKATPRSDNSYSSPPAAPPPASPAQQDGGGDGGGAEVEKLFAHYNVSGTGFLDFEEFSAAVQRDGLRAGGTALSAGELREIFIFVDRDGDIKEGHRVAHKLNLD